MKFLKCCGRIYVVLDMLVLIPIFGNSTGRICAVLDMLVLIPIFGTSTTHIPSGQT